MVFKVLEMTGESPDPKKEDSGLTINYFNCVSFTLLHILAIYCLGLIFEGQFHIATLLFSVVLTFAGGIGNTVGSHRLFAHKSYKAVWPLRALLVFFQTLMVQDSVWRWVAWHRVHHKYSETHADPHNAKRGFFYSHIGWLLIYDRNGFWNHLNSIDMSDLNNDPVVMWQHRNYDWIVLFVGLTMPVFVPCYLWEESVVTSIAIGIGLRLTYNFHTTFLVNSAAHLWGSRPYDKSINPSQNRWVSALALGEGWHNYHHVFPWDYRASELGLYEWNPSAALIEFFARMGWAYDLKTVSKQVVQQRIKNTGEEPEHPDNAPWGWGDKDTPKESIHLTQTLFKAKG